jgi:hypothetical protein
VILIEESIQGEKVDKQIKVVKKGVYHPDSCDGDDSPVIGRQQCSGFGILFSSEVGQ